MSGIPSKASWIRSRGTWHPPGVERKAVAVCTPRTPALEQCGDGSCVLLKRETASEDLVGIDHDRGTRIDHSGSLYRPPVRNNLNPEGMIRGAGRFVTASAPSGRQSTLIDPPSDGIRQGGQDHIHPKLPARSRRGLTGSIPITSRAPGSLPARPHRAQKAEPWMTTVLPRLIRAASVTQPWSLLRS